MGEKNKSLKKKNGGGDTTIGKLRKDQEKEREQEGGQMDGFGRTTEKTT